MGQLTFERFPQHVNGMVGGFPQKSLWASRAPQIDRGLWLVGDSVFPGQSIAGVTLGALRVAREIERTLAARLPGRDQPAYAEAIVTSE